MKQFSTHIQPRHSSRTDHCKLRMQQRCIPGSIVDLLIDFGDASYVVGGAEKYAFTKRSWRKACSYLGAQAKHFDTYRNAYVVVGLDGSVITAAYQH